MRAGRKDVESPMRTLPARIQRAEEEHVSLQRYKEKRDFSRTAEPAGRARSARARDESKVLFVVQKHAARRLHYDFRLEINGVLKSWAVPKGFPITSGEKRLAMEVEDHPVEYANFEGVIPEGNYGAGSVMLWDAGVCDVTAEAPARALKSGKLPMRLEGKKLKGTWTLVRMHSKEGADDRAWLLIKTGGDTRPISQRSEDRSVQSGRSMKQIASEASATWELNRKPNATRKSPSAAKKAGTRRKSARS